MYDIGRGDEYMADSRFVQALDILKDRYSENKWVLVDIPDGSGEKMFRWPGRDEEDIIVVVKGDSDELQQFHRHEYFYFNHIISGQQDMTSLKYDRIVTLKQDDFYAGQPFAGHAAIPTGGDVVMVCLIVRPELVFSHFLPSLSTSSAMVNFLLNPATDSYSQEIIHFNAKNNMGMRRLLEMMVIEYAENKEDTQALLKPLLLAYLMQVSRQYSIKTEIKKNKSVSADIVHYINEHVADVTLGSIAMKFSYHPNYVSAMLKKETGKTFSEILLQQRMERALIMLQGTNLPVERVSAMLGYSNPSNFHKAFREYYHKSPREYVNGGK